MKTPLLTCLLAIGCCAALNAQQLNAPKMLLPGGAPVVPASPATEVEKLAEEAQKSLYQSVDKAGGASSTKSSVTSTSNSLRLPSPRPEDPSLWTKESTHKIAVMEVAFGGMKDTVMIELYSNDAPQTVNSFIDRCDSGFYNGLAFHRAIESFLVQTGDPLTSDESAREKWGTGGEDKTLPAEIKRPHRIGAVAMARRADSVNPERRSNGSQFYITLGNYASIDNKYTVFGQVVSGLDAIKRISLMPVDANDCPVARIEVKSIKVIDHKGPLQVEPELAGDGQRYSKPNSARGFVGRFLNRVW
ncbi:MAG: peptidylprolyl isomerase [Prosthecobacter sp.]|uniref:peptidylprolyl isomerase n=1 Tax=Prosthecobacter sp. TaxID=1965333 RepID=UPI003902A4EF